MRRIECNPALLTPVLQIQAATKLCRAFLRQMSPRPAHKEEKYVRHADADLIFPGTTSAGPKPLRSR